MNTVTVPSQDEAQIRQLMAQQETAMRERDAERLVSRYAPDAVLFDLAPPLRHIGPELHDANGVRSWLAGFDGPIGLEIRDLTVTVGEDVAFCHSLNRLSATPHGAPESFELWFRATVCLRKLDGTCRSPTSTSRRPSTWTDPSRPPSTSSRRADRRSALPPTRREARVGGRTTSCLHEAGHGKGCDGGVGHRPTGNGRAETRVAGGGGHADGAAVGHQNQLAAWVLGGAPGEGSVHPPVKVGNALPAARRETIRVPPHPVDHVLHRAAAERLREPPAFEVAEPLLA
jgi:ketosteroid isomerase-like protein